MFTNKLNSQAVITNKRVSKLPHALAIMSTSLMIGLSMASMSAQAAGLGELFANNGAEKSKFLPVDKAFQVISSSKATSKARAYLLILILRQAIMSIKISLLSVFLRA
ncbi:hypothetical protein [Psychrobacter sp. JCM 18903]|uniref:hypothetical protein n=1 Tax=Psychrobacter sp. JCM 18903 TaxID=1298610 RepID=UPI001FB05B46|nr:hypothetical protein [Psychrobacter sp. JCM 18903]